MNELQTETLGIPGEVKPGEGRVAATPELVRRLVKQGVRVLVQSGAGIRSGYPDRDYRKAGARLVRDAARVWKESSVILKVKEPLGPELKWLRPDLLVVCYLHLAAAPELTRALLMSGAMAVGLETLVDSDGKAPMLIPMSKIAGRLAILEGAFLLAKHPDGMGKYLGAVAGAQAAQVVVLGAGAAGQETVRAAIGLSADVTVIDRNAAALESLSREYGGAVKTHMSEPAVIEACVKRADLLIACAYRAGERAPVLVRRSLVKKMKRGSVIVDIAIDQGGCVETSRPGTHANPVRVVDGVIHYAVPNMPGAVPLTSTEAFSHALEPHLVRLFQNDPRLVIYEDPLWRSGLNTVDHEIIHQGVQKAYFYK